MQVAADALTTIAGTRTDPNIQPKSPESPSRSAPVTCIITSVPPDVGPVLGLTDHSDPAAMYSYRAWLLSSSTPLLLIDTDTMPASRAGTVQATVDDERNMPFTMSLSPNMHPSSADCLKSRPTTVTTCPSAPLSPCEGFSNSTTADAPYANSRPSMV